MWENKRIIDVDESVMSTSQLNDVVSGIPDLYTIDPEIPFSNGWKRDLCVNIILVWE